MLEAVGDIWAYEGWGVIVITTNGSVNRSGLAVFGQGVARQAAVRHHRIAEYLGSCLRAGGNHVYDLGGGLVSFPVEETPWSQPDLRLIRRSAQELRRLADASGWRTVVVPRPGCGGGGLAWHDVRPVIEPLFDDRFIIISMPDAKTTAACLKKL